jgi:acetyl-CoA carboxylase carboxyl transferase subunit beta
MFKRRRFVSVIGRGSRVPDDLWMKCPACKKAVLRADVSENLNVCTLCQFHHRITAQQRIKYTADPETFEEMDAGMTALDPLDFTIPAANFSYKEKLESYRKRHGLNEALVTGAASVVEQRTVLGVMDFRFAGASMGSVVGEKFCRGAERAIEERVPYVVFCASGGARMHEGLLSLMQMAKTAGVVGKMNEAGVPYISVLTNPTTGGVTASFATLGDIVLSEPGAEIGFAGKRLIEGALKEKLPPGFQTAEYQLEHGFIDEIVHRRDMRSILGRLLRYLAPRQ